MDMDAEDLQPATKGDIKAAIETLSRGHGARMDGFDRRIDGLDSRMDALDSRMDGLDSRMDGFDSRMDGLDRRMECLDRKIDYVHKSLAVQIVKTQGELSELRETVSTKEDIRKVLGAIQDFAARAEAYGRIATAHGQALTDDQITLKDHERRLRRLES
jgi:chromosome segregation ATPase